MANIITGIRIVLSVALLFFPALSPAFFVLYIAGGLSDMIDGAVARRTGTVSEFGSRLDTFADIVFAAVCLIKLLPILDVPVWLYVWVAVIAIIKFSMNALPLSTRLFLMNGLLFHLPKTIWCYTEHLLEAADELPRITIADLITNLIQFPVFRFQQLRRFSQFKIFDSF